MITFKNLRWKNFLSTGNAFTELTLDASPTTLIVGENGSGKSTVLDALCFALFNRPFRNINKPQLCNSINSKNTVVEVEFNLGKNEYKIRRGMRPGLFEIFCNDVMVNQDAGSRDYQKYLEETILKMNFRSFTQIVILGSASFKPFMQLAQGQRRDLIEDILDIQVFTVMNNLLKDQVSDLKVEISRVETEIKMAIHTAKIQEEYITTLKKDREERISEIETKIVEINGEISHAEKDIQDLEAQQEALQLTIKDRSEVEKNRQKVQTSLTKIDTEISRLAKEVQFYQSNDSCPTCKQGIEEEFKADIVSKKGEQITELRGVCATHKEDVGALTSRLSEIIDSQAKIQELGKSIVRLNQLVVTQERHTHALILEKSDLQTKVGNIELEKEKLRSFAKAVVKKTRAKSKLAEEKHYLETAGSLLKDTGIKTKIIRQYLPAINKLVNKYLAAMDFFVQFQLDETFSESIKSRHRDEFSYHSFSEGEKQRIDLALLFTWRTIAKMKNSAATNILFLDEVFDSSLDANGTDYVMNLLNTIGDGTHVWVISHKGDILFDRFNQVVKFEKKQNFSVIA
jgi:DNA repair exonuclease SbcCD ATPase subunit